MCIRDSIYPIEGLGVFPKLVEIELNGAVSAANGGEHGLKALEAVVEIYLHAVVDTEGADAADRVADELKHLVGGEHLRLVVEFLLELVVVYARVASRQDEQRASVGTLEGEALGYARALDTQGFGRCV